MSTSELESMKKQAGELEAQIRALPQQPGRDELLREIEVLRAKLDREIQGY